MEKEETIYICRCCLKNSNNESLMPFFETTGETILQSLNIAYQGLNEHVQKNFKKELKSPIGTTTYTLSMNVYLFDDRTDQKDDHLSEYEKMIYKPCFSIKFEGNTFDDVLFKLRLHVIFARHQSLCHIYYCGGDPKYQDNVCYRCPICVQYFWGRPKVCPTCHALIVWRRSKEPTFFHLKPFDSIEKIDGKYEPGDGKKVKICLKDVPHHLQTLFNIEFFCLNCRGIVSYNDNHCRTCNAEIIWE